jgi:hypothetical protein
MHNPIFDPILERTVKIDTIGIFGGKFTFVSYGILPTLSVLSVYFE